MDRRSTACGRSVTGAGLDEMYVNVKGEMVYLWRALDHEGEILESYVAKTRDKAVALIFMKKVLKRQRKSVITHLTRCLHCCRHP